MVIIETSIFTKRIQSLMLDEEYRLFQSYLTEIPDVGDLIQGGGGIRKVRWKLEGRGKRGGVRIIYYWATSQGQLLMLYAFAKNEQENLSKEQLSVLKQVVESEFKR